MRIDSKIEKENFEATYKYPNLALEYALSNQERRRAMAAYARVTQELFEASLRRDSGVDFLFLEGMDISKFTRKNGAYLFKNELDVFDMEEHDHRKKIKIKLKELADLRKQYSEPTNEQLEKNVKYIKGNIGSRKLVPRAHYDNLVKYIKFIKGCNDARSSIRPIRTL